MKETELKTFVEGVMRYFATITSSGAKVGVPYVKAADHAVEDITGIIGMTGPRKGHRDAEVSSPQRPT